jgi:hypothetical protein
VANCSRARLGIPLLLLLMTMSAAVRAGAQQASALEGGGAYSSSGVFVKQFSKVMFNFECLGLGVLLTLNSAK